MTVAHLEALILERLIEAQVVLDRSVTRPRPKGPTTFWPDAMPESKPIDTDDPRPPTPSAAAITRMEETWGWLAEIKDLKLRKAVVGKVAAWVHDRSTSSLARELGINRVTLNRRFNSGLHVLIVKFCK
ncbi:hypothetical protein TRICHSKD4_5916 [Roseibium sp. TrichSKD4]|uniref:DUF6362 family protein n=1 Tax=Roseibium sp. TrichSKD4 TaxID=744980 RepID=UPI0001E576BD|nr:DUF6362 family protein [Roseibium sp. TrichSKD4]EFO30073.1 hypothetical protein TRICHSKD4_5916 [Roseibium sp. TrichSKD4]